MFSNATVYHIASYSALAIYYFITSLDIAVTMSRFKNKREQEMYINDSDKIFTDLIKQLPKESQNSARNTVNEYYEKWNKILQVQPKIIKPVDTLKMYKDLKDRVQFGE